MALLFLFLKGRFYMSPAEYINKELDREKQAFARAAGRPGVTDEELFHIREKIEVLRKINDILIQVSKR